MINGYSISTADMDKFKEFKNSAAYGSYLISISQSPAFKIILSEHVENVDITKDINYLKSKDMLPKNTNSSTLNTIYKESIKKIAVNLLADSIILTELENVRISDIIDDLSSEADIEYLLGKANKKYYEKAYEMLRNGKLDSGSTTYKGLLNYLKINKINDMNELGKPKETAVTEFKNKPISKKEAVIDIDSDNIKI